MAFFVIELVVGVGRTSRLSFLSKSAWKTIWIETRNRSSGWLSYQAKPYSTREHVIWLRRRGR
jgi:hypothetical protein